MTNFHIQFLLFQRSKIDIFHLKQFFLETNYFLSSDLEKIKNNFFRLILMLSLFLIKYKGKFKINKNCKNESILEKKT